MPSKLVDININEVSAVDRAANMRKFLIIKRDYSEDERKEMADKGEAMSDGSFPIKTAKDVENAVHDWGRSGSKNSVKQHIIRRAKALGAEDKIPEDWQVEKKGGSNLKKRWEQFKKYLMHDYDCNDGAKSFENIIDDWKADDTLYDATQALNQAVDSILDDETISDKKGAITQSLQQFLEYLLDEGIVKMFVQGVSKAGRKINSKTLSAMKEMHGHLGDIINEAENNPEGDDENMTDEEKKKQAEEKEAMQKRMSDLEKKAQENDELKKRADELQKRLEETEAIAKAEKEERLNKEYIAKAASFGSLAIKADDFGPVLKAIADKDPDNFAKLEGVLKAANEAIAKGSLFKENGREGYGGETSVEKKVEAMAAELQKSDTSLSKSAAIAKVYKDNPDIYKQYQSELKRR